MGPLRLHVVWRLVCSSGQFLKCADSDSLGSEVVTRIRAWILLRHMVPRMGTISGAPNWNQKMSPHSRGTLFGSYFENQNWAPKREPKHGPQTHFASRILLTSSLVGDQQLQANRMARGRGYSGVVICMVLDLVALYGRGGRGAGAGGDS